MLVIIDNYDSFTHNIFQYFCMLGQEVVVVRNNESGAGEILSCSPDHIVISPGPGRPCDTGVCSDILDAAAHAMIPVLGVCLGHQLIGEKYGARVVHASRVMHGVTSDIYHNNTGIFHGIPYPCTVARYHSLIVRGNDCDVLPDCLEMTAWTVINDRDDQCAKTEIMGIRHRYLPFDGVQFHPEAIQTRCGLQIFENFISTTRSF